MIQYYQIWKGRICMIRTGILFGMGLFLVIVGAYAPSPTPEERHQQRLSDISGPPHIDDRRDGLVEYIVTAVFDDFPHSAFVRVILVPVGEGAILVAQHPRCEPLVIGKKVELIFANYNNSEYNNDFTFYIKTD